VINSVRTINNDEATMNLDVYTKIKEATIKGNGPRPKREAKE
jgi:hypothetical protein